MARNAESTPKFPYTTRPAALRKFLSQVPKRPKPVRVNRELLASWDIKGNDTATGIIRVLKALGLVNASGEPSDDYTQFMQLGTGPTVLGKKIRQVYAPLFGASLEPYKESADSLKNLFNIHSGGAPATIDHQIQTFKALCENASFSGGPVASAQQSGGPGAPAPSESGRGAQSELGAATIHIDLHIHLPENKSSRDYQYIIQDIARFIYRHTDSDESRRD